MFRMSREDVLTPERLAYFINLNKEENRKRFDKFIKLYQAKNPIFRQENKPAYKPDNRIAVNFAKYIVDTFNGFFIGNPIKTTCSDSVVAEKVEFIEKMNDQDDNNAELAKMMSVYGRAFEMYFVTHEKEIGITYVSPQEAFIIYDEGIVEEPLYFVHYYTNEDGEEVGSVSDATCLWYFSRSGEQDFYTFEGPTVHNFDGVPASEFIENEERMSIFESVISLMEAYDKALSEKANDVDYFADAYLKVLGAKLEKEDLKDLRNQRIINLEGVTDADLDVEFLAKPNADATQENFLDKLERLIYTISMVPNVNDETFGTSSGIAMKYKLFNTMNLFKVKQRKFTSGMNRRWKLIFTHPIVNVEKSAWTKLEYQFTPNIPANVLEEAQTVSQLTNIVSQATQLKYLSIVDNVQNEMEEIEKEKENESLLGLDDFEAGIHEDLGEDIDE